MRRKKSRGISPKWFVLSPLFSLIFFSAIMLISQGCGGETGAGGKEKETVPTDEIMGIEKSEIEAVKTGLLTARVISASQNTVKSRKAKIITGRYRPSFGQFGFSPLTKIKPKQLMPGYSFCECQADYMCNAGMYSNGNIVGYDVRGKNQAMKYTVEGDISAMTGDVKIGVYEGTCENIPPKVCDENNNLNYNFEQNCDFVFSGYLILESGGGGLMCLEPSETYGTQTTLVIDFATVLSEADNNVSYTLYYMLGDNLKKITCEVEVGAHSFSCTIYTAQEDTCSLSGCTELTKELITNCTFSPEKSCQMEECADEFAKIFSEDIISGAIKKGDNMCERVDTSTGDIIRIEGSVDSWIYTISSDNKVDTKVCSMNSEVDLDRCEITCDEISSTSPVVEEYSETLTGAEYKIRFEDENIKGKIDVQYDKVKMKAYFSGKIQVKGVELTVQGEVSSDGSISMVMKSDMFSANVDIKGNIVQGELTYKGQKYTIKTEGGEVKICDSQGQCV